MAVSLGIVCGGANRALAQTEPATDLSTRIDSLEKQLADLKSQMEAQKAAAAPAPVPAAAAAALPAAAPATPAPTGLAGLLGPTTLSGFVDVYYGYNSNQPAERSTALRNFDVNSSQFALNMLELVADKPVSTDTGRVGYHVALGFGQAMNLVNAGEFASPTIPGTPLLGPPSDHYQLRPISEGRISGVSRAGGQGSADQRREVRDPGWCGSHRDQGQLELFSRTPVFLGHSLFPLWHEREVRLQQQVCANRLPGERLEQQRRQQQRQDYRLHGRLDSQQQVRPD